MGDSYRVVLDDLVGASATFAREATEFRAVMPELGPACPDGGDPAFNGVLRGVVEAVGLLHTQIAGALDQHAGRLSQAHQRYVEADYTIHHLCRRLIDTADLT